MIVTLPYQGFQETTKENGEKVKTPIEPKHVLQNLSPFLDVALTHPKSIADKFRQEGKEVKSIKVRALIDTGASGCVITKRVAGELNLIQTGFQKITSVQDEQDRPVFNIQLIFHWGAAISVPAAECPIKGFDCIIGRNVISHWNMIYNGAHGYIIIND